MWSGGSANGGMDCTFTAINKSVKKVGLRMNSSLLATYKITNSQKPTGPSIYGATDMVDGAFESRNNHCPGASNLRLHQVLAATDGKGTLDVTLTVQQGGEVLAMHINHT